MHIWSQCYVTAKGAAHSTGLVGLICHLSFFSHCLEAAARVRSEVLDLTAAESKDAALINLQCLQPSSTLKAALGGPKTLHTLAL